MASFKIKERRAAKIFESLLKENGYGIVKLNCEDALPAIISKGKKVDYESFREDIRYHDNDFIILGQQPLFVEVRFVEGKIRKNDLKERKSFGDIALIFITKDDFYIARLNDFIDTGSFEQLEKNSIIRIKPDLIDKYKEELKQKLK